MISEEEARRKILEAVRPLPTRLLPIFQSVGCFAGESYLSRLPLPVFDNSAMDGYAVIASDSKCGKRLHVTGEQPAGPDRHFHVSRGEAVRIFTGAPIPAGADAIVMQEDVGRDGDEITLNTEVASGDFIRRRGCDLAEGQKILAKGEPLRAGTIALMASQGFTHVVVGGQVTAAIVSTGDELVSPGEKIQRGQIYESNSALLHVLLQRCGANVKSVEHSRDERESLIGVITRGIENDILIISGGVSVGEHDLVRATLRYLSAKIDIWRVAIKPGKPFLFGRIAPSPQSSPSARERRTRSAGEGSRPSSQCLIFGLPGNPVSAFVTFLQFVRPAILRMMSASNLDLPKLPAKLAEDLTNDNDRTHYIRGKLKEGRFSPSGRQESHALFGLSQSNGLLRMGVGESLKAGELVDVQMWD